MKTPLMVMVIDHDVTNYTAQPSIKKEQTQQPLISNKAFNFK
jgi:hypothetical protein